MTRCEVRLASGDAPTTAIVLAPRMICSGLLTVGKGCPNGLGAGVLPEAQDGEDRHENDLGVEPERPVLDVEVVPLDPLAQRRVPEAFRAAPDPVHLRPAGDARLHAVPLVVAMDRPLECLDELGALGTRPDEAHLAA